MAVIRKVDKPLAVHVVLQVQLQGEDAEVDSPALRLAKELYTRLARGARPAGVPIHLWKGRRQSDGSLVLPSRPSLGDAARNAVLLLVDQDFFDCRKKWQTYLKDLFEEYLSRKSRPECDLLLPVSISGNAHRVAPSLNNINCVPVRDPGTVFEDEHVFQAILTAILRLLPESSTPELRKDAPRGAGGDADAPPVFLCHTKSDGDCLAREIRRYIYEETQLHCFFDTHDIPHGRPVREAIQDTLATSCLLVIWTDQLLESRWCQFEILEARSQQRPIVVLDALTRQAPRIFPFLGNMPVVRWNGHPGPALSALLLELVRIRYVQALFEALRSGDGTATVLRLHPPDLMEAKHALAPSKQDNARSTADPQRFVYPDPPLPAEEMAFLAQAFPGILLHSLSEWTALRAAGVLPERYDRASNRPAPLASMTIGLSVSVAETWASYGLILEHQDDFLMAMARELILLGARLLWGGDLDPEKIGGRLESVVRAYHQADHAPQDHIASYLAWPIYREAKAEDLQKRRAFADVICQEKPEVPDTCSAAFNALCFSIMRRTLAEDCQARIILGGKVKRYLGIYPGIAEEAFETICNERPLYIVGGFGGAAEGVYHAIARRGGGALLRKAWHERAAGSSDEEMHAPYEEMAKRLKLRFKVDHEAMLQRFRDYGPEGLSQANKLSIEENKRLAASRDIHEILALLVKGLSRLGRQAT